MRKTVSTLLILILVSAAACTDDQRKKIAKADQDMANALSIALDIDAGLIRDGTLKGDAAVAVTTTLLDINRALGIFNTHAKAITTLDTATKSDLLLLADGIVKAVADANQAGAIHINNQETRAKLASVLAIISAAITTLRAILQGGA